MGDKKLLTVYLFVILIGVGLAYQFAISKSVLKISELEWAIQEKEREFTGTTKTSDALSTVPSTGTLNCLLCHDLLLTKSFHLPQTILKIDEKQGKRRRVCIDCHGPNAYDEDGKYLGWSADRQMTPVSMISFDEKTGVNGVFEFSGSVSHSIHKRLLYSLKVITCDDCHLFGDEIERPVVDVGKGQVLVCQNCKYHPEEGNYIKIHVEEGGNGCQTCHTGRVIEVHKEKTFNLGRIS
jgi:hypothetical protein